VVCGILNQGNGGPFVPAENGPSEMSPTCVIHVVLYPEKGVCADPVNEGAILGRGGPSPHSRVRECQLAPDIVRGET
jgi:hypothetical protein